MPSLLPNLIETIRIRNGVAPLWYLHLRRLATSCRALGVPLPRELITPAGGEDRAYRLEVGMHGVQISERPVGNTAALRLIISRVTHRAYPHKTTDRAQFDEALAEAHAADADDALLLTPGGRFVAEAAVSAVLWLDGDRVCGPPLDLGILPGVGRARVAELAGGVDERRATVEELRGKSLFVVNAVRGIAQVVSLDGVPVPPAPRVVALAGRFWP